MIGIDQSKIFKPVSIAVLTVSDTRNFETDSSGQILQDRIEAAGHHCAARHIITDDSDKIRDFVTGWISDETIDVIITTGGTGLTGRDVTVEAITPLLDKVIDGFSVIFHMESFKTIGLSTLQSRAMAGLAGQSFIFCLPGSNGAVKDGWDRVIKDQLDSRHGPCNMVELMPRLGER